VNDKKYDVFGVGNAIVDILALVQDQSLADLELAKGGMALMDAETQSGVLQHLEGHSLKLASGGSAANTMVAVAQSGGNGVYFGKVANDTHGHFYKRDMEAAGIAFPVPAADEADLPTGTSVILTTPDAERTMCTHLGISTTLHKSDIDIDILAQSRISYIEGYLWDAEHPREACIESFEQSQRLGVRTAFTFSDGFLIDRFADDFRKIIADYADIVFCNQDEAHHFFQTDDLNECISKLGQACDLAFITCSEHGCHVIENGASKHVHGFPVKAIDTVGAGDAFAGGVLFGLTHGMSPTESARWGNYFASRVVEHLGPRLESSMQEHLQSVIV
jgi:sugar/nucleoside kinase (ribokinase family)